MKKIFSVVVMALLIGALLFSVGFDNNPQPVEQQSRTLTFEEIVVQNNNIIDKKAITNPEEEVEAIISLTEFCNIKSTDSYIEFPQNSLKLEGFFNGFIGKNGEAYLGGYEIPNGFDVQDAIADYEKQYSSFLNEIIPKVEDSIKSIQDPKEKVAKEKLLSDLIDRKNEFEQKGLQIYALKVKGKVKDLKQIKQNSKKVRLIQFLSRSGPTVPFLPSET